MDFYFSYLNGKILKGFETGMMTGITLIDLYKVFDSIDHDLLLQKLYTNYSLPLLYMDLNDIYPADHF